ncbi:MAG: DUF418 domain-containing protein [Chitinophagaceae bacterium]|nr:MAG: DUF418 domain-containing protein [Chitinophagaceae bacterium]
MIARATAPAVPATTGLRAPFPDALRGFALLGICLANAGYFSLFIFQPRAFQENLSLADAALAAVHTVLVEGKFYSLFSLLFGFGFAMLFYGGDGGKGKGLAFFYRRLGVLALFGLAHSFLVWDGDILFFYALTGCLLPLFRNCSDRSLLRWAVALLLAPFLFDVVKILTDNRWNIANGALARAIASSQKYGIGEADTASWLVTHGRYTDLLHWNQGGFWFDWQHRLDSNRVPKVLGLFVLGLWVGRTRFYARLADHRPLLRRIATWGFAIGLPAGAALQWSQLDGVNLPQPGGLLDTLFYALNVVPVALAYAGTLALLHSAGRWGPVFAALQPVGQMALTNYVLQSVLGIIIYFGVGFGLGGGIGPSVYMPVALAVFGLQVLYSGWWMRRFRFGPLEWLWRQATYGRRLPLRR